MLVGFVGDVVLAPLLPSAANSPPLGSGRGVQKPASPYRCPSCTGPCRMLLVVVSLGVSLLFSAASPAPPPCSKSVARRPVSPSRCASCVQLRVVFVVFLTVDAVTESVQVSSQGQSLQRADPRHGGRSRVTVQVKPAAGLVVQQSMVLKLQARAAKLGQVYPEDQGLVWILQT